MKIGIIGEGAIGRYVRNHLQERNHEILAILVRSSRLPGLSLAQKQPVYVSSVDDLPDDLEHVIDCAGHQALKAYGPKVIDRGFDLTTVSIGALADKNLYNELYNSATKTGAQLHLASGAIGALDCLRAARIGQLHSVTYVGRKPPKGWKGSPADTRLNLDNLSNGAETHFEGSARDAAIAYPKNANVAAAVALAGLGFDKTLVKLIADPDIHENIHRVSAVGDFGRFTFEMKGQSLPDNPRSSALAAMSVISTLEQLTQPITF